MLKEATKYMADLGAAMYKKLTKLEESEYSIVLSGGLFGKTEYFQEFAKQFYELIDINSQKVKRLQQSPCIGGIKIAMKRIIQNQKYKSEGESCEQRN